MKRYQYKSPSTIINRAISECLKDTYECAYPECNYDNVERICKEAKGEPIKKTGKSGKKYEYPFDFYYMPQQMQEDIIENYLNIYNLKATWQDDVQTVIDYITEHPIVQVYKDHKREYITDLTLKERFDEIIPDKSEECVDIVLELLTKCRNYYKFGTWEESCFKVNTLLRFPSSNREIVINAWKDVYDKDIEIPNDTIWNEEELF